MNTVWDPSIRIYNSQGCMNSNIQNCCINWSSWEDVFQTFSNITSPLNPTWGSSFCLGSTIFTILNLHNIYKLLGNYWLFCAVVLEKKKFNHYSYVILCLTLNPVLGPSFSQRSRFLWFRIFNINTSFYVNIGISVAVVLEKKFLKHFFYVFLCYKLWTPSGAPLKIRGSRFL